MNAKYLTRADIKKIEEGLDTQDLETMVAYVDRIVELRLKAQSKKHNTAMDSVFGN